jgi:transposase
VIQLTSHMRILLAVAPVDFRRRMDGLARLCREVLGSDPQGGAVFCFKSRKGTAVRLLSYDGQGFWLCEKRLSVGKFKWWPKEGHQGVTKLDVHELQLLLWNGNPAQAKAAPMWRPITSGTELPPAARDAPDRTSSAQGRP